MHSDFEELSGLRVREAAKNRGINILDLVSCLAASYVAYTLILCYTVSYWAQ